MFHPLLSQSHLLILEFRFFSYQYDYLPRPSCFAANIPQPHSTCKESSPPSPNDASISENEDEPLIGECLHCGNQSYAGEYCVTCADQENIYDLLCMTPFRLS